MSSRADKTATVPAEDLRGRLRAYYTRYYRDTLGIPGWRDLVRPSVWPGSSARWVVPSAVCAS